MTEEAADGGSPSRGEEQENIEERPLSPWRDQVWTMRAEAADTGRLAEELAERLQLASTILLDRLFDYLSRLPAEEDSSDRPLGLTLPASAIGWLSTQLFPQVDSLGDEDRPSDHAALWMGPSMRDRLASLKFLLPRVTHVRVTSEEWPPSRPEKSSVSHQHQNFEGQDVDPDAMSVQSTLTVESAVPPRPSLRAFLFQYYVLQNRPRVDLELFPSLKVLLLDRIPPEWVVNLHVVRDSLELLRTERACIYNLTDFLFPVQEDGKDTEGSGNGLAVFGRLTHLKLKNCAVGELSGLKGQLVEREDEGSSHVVDENDVLAPITAHSKLQLPPPFSRLPNLVSLSLAHNELRSARTALAGLSALPLLRRLDLSYNYLTHMRGANAMLGNIKVLILSGNRIRTVKGLDRLYSLERLSLDQNNLKDLASVAGLAKLPELRSLKLIGNPLVEPSKFLQSFMVHVPNPFPFHLIFSCVCFVVTEPRKYRVDVLNLFREQRFVDFPTNATYRQLLEELPVLDGKPTSKAELVGLRGFTFAQLVGLVEDDTAPEGNRAETRILTASTDGASHEFHSVVAPPVSVTKRLNRVSRRGKPRKIIIEESPVENVEVHSSMSEASSGRASLKDDGDITKNIHFSLTDLVATLPSLTPIAPEGDERECEPELPLDGEAKELRAAQDQNDNMRPPPEIDSSAMNGARTESPAQKSLQQQDVPDPARGLSFISLSPVLKDGSMQVSMAPETDMGATIDFESQTNPQSPSHKVVGEKLAGASQSGHPSASDVGDRDKGENGQVTKETVQTQLQNLATTVDEPDAPSTDAELPERADQFEAILSPAPETIVFPDYVWEEDENSVLSSIKTNTVNAASLESKYQKAEEESVYDGLDHLKGLPVLTNLELYFRCFVFRVSITDKQQNFQDEQSDEEKLKLMLDLAPRIQLRPVDWRALESTARSVSPMEIYAMTERFDRVWREEALACGKLAAKRLTPHRKPKRGFHGDVLFSNGKLQKSCECRSLIVCASDVAVYFISDYDAVTRHQLTKAGKRRFPLPIPEVLFQNAPWPHAYARHPIATLDRITIGFGFQRLSLHFRPARGSGEFTYILITCNKLRTVNLLQHFQSLAKEFASRPSSSATADALKIDNDDKQVLDALAEAVAPSSVGMVLHYQIVQQRWQHGDRGTVRRACIVTDTHLYLHDEDYVGDGSESFEAGARKLGEVCFKMVDSAAIEHVTEVQAGLDDPNSVTVVIKPSSRLQRYHRWRLMCNDREGAERLVEDIRKAMPDESFES